MASVKWIKIVTDIFDDEKMLLIETMPDADSIIVVWFKLLCLAGKTNNSGVFILNERIPYTDEMLAAIFRRNVNTVRLALKTFQDFGMVEIVDNVITIPNWSKHQTLDAYERQKERDRLKKQKKRAEQKALIAGSADDKSGDRPPDTSEDTSGDVPIIEEDIEEDRDLEEERDNSSLLPGAETAPAHQKTQAATSPVIITILLNDKTEYPVRETDVDAWKELYPAVDVMQELRKMKGWADANPTKRKTKTGIKRFINSWLSKEQDKYHGPDAVKVPQGNAQRDTGFQTSNPFLEMLDERRGQQ